MLDTRDLDDPEISALKEQLLSLVSSRALIESDELIKTLGWDAESYWYIGELLIQAGVLRAEGKKGEKLGRVALASRHAESETQPAARMKSTENIDRQSMRTIPFAAFSQEQRETFHWLCRRSMKNPDDFAVEGREHAPDSEGSLVHRDVVVRYVPTGKGRRYCPDYGESWIVKFSDDLDAHYFTPQDRTVPRGLVCWS